MMTGLYSDRVSQKSTVQLTALYKPFYAESHFVFNKPHPNSKNKELFSLSFQKISSEGYQCFLCSCAALDLQHGGAWYTGLQKAGDLELRDVQCGYHGRNHTAYGCEMYAWTATPRARNR